MTIFIIAGILLYAVIHILTSKKTELVDKAFAGKPKGSANAIEVKKEPNRTIYTENGEERDLSMMRRFIIEGNSLEKAGLNDGVTVYTDLVYDKERPLSISGYFIILKIDNERTMAEHPEMTDYIEGFKARKLVTVFPTKMSRQEFDKKMTPILTQDGDVEEAAITDCKEHLWGKYDFASSYYNTQGQLLVSITYKDGETKDYSFHSLEYLAGIVKFKDVA